MPYYVAAGTSLTATSTFTILSNGNTGVGTTTPYATFSINGKAAGTTDLFAIATSSASYATTTALRVDSNGNLYLKNGATLTLASLAVPAGTFLAADANGKIIATTTPGFTNTLAGGGTATTTFYAGGLVFSDGTKLTQAANSGANTLYWDTTNSRLGIGTSSPYADLSVTGTSNGTSPLFAISISTTAFLVDKNGKIGIRTTQPINDFDIVSNSSTSLGDYQTTAGLRVDDGTSDTGLLAGVDNSLHAVYIQGVQPLASWTNRQLLLQPLGGNVTAAGRFTAGTSSTPSFLGTSPQIGIVSADGHTALAVQNSSNAARFALNTRTHFNNNHLIMKNPVVWR